LVGDAGRRTQECGNAKAAKLVEGNDKAISGIPGVSAQEREVEGGARPGQGKAIVKRPTSRLLGSKTNWKVKSGGSARDAQSSQRNS